MAVSEHKEFSTGAIDFKGSNWKTFANHHTRSRMGRWSKTSQQRKAKGLLCSNSQTCTLSQNGYGACSAIPSCSAAARHEKKISRRKQRPSQKLGRNKKKILKKGCLFFQNTLKEAHITKNRSKHKALMEETARRSCQRKENKISQQQMQHKSRPSKVEVGANNKAEERRTS